MRIYISSTSADLEPHRTVALDLAREIGLEPIVRDPAPRPGLSQVEACDRQLAAADLLLAIVGWRQGEVPGPELGGDGARSWTEWEVKSAFDRGLPVAVLMAADSWPESSREADSVESFNELRETFPSADWVEGIIVFNIGGNKYRLIAAVHFNRGKIFVRHVLTHEDYDQGAWMP